MYDPEKDYQLMFARLKDICQKKNITNYALAKATNLSNSSISNLMSGKTKPYLYTILLICSALDISIMDLFGDNKEGNIEEQHIIHTYRMLSQEKKKLIRIYLDMLIEYNGKL